MSRVRSMVLCSLFAVAGAWIAALSLGLLADAAARPTRGGLSHQRTLAAYGRLPLSFAQNRGQAPPDVAYVARGAGWTLGLGRGGAVLSLAHSQRSSSSLLTVSTPGGTLGSPSAEQRLPGRASYFSGNNPHRWVTGAPTFARIVYRDAWPGVDLAFHGHQGTLEYDLDLAPGADPGRVVLRFAGAQAVRPDGHGGAVIKLGGATVRIPAPRAKQGRDAVSSRLVVSRETVRLALGSYDQARALVVDPDLVYSTYVGDYAGRGIAVDSNGDAFLAMGPLCKYGSGNSVVAELNPSGTAVLYSTELGNATSSCTSASGIAVDSSGDAYVAGGGSVPITPGAYQSACASAYGNGFVTKLNPAGSLVYSTYLCGGDPTGIAVDPSGEAYVTGQAGTSFSTTAGAYQTTYGGGNSYASQLNDAFVAKLNPAGSGLVYSTYLGGGGGASGSGIALDSSGNAYLTGYAGASFPTTSGAYQTKFRGRGQNNAGLGSNAFVSKLNPSGSALVYSTYLGGNGGSGDRGTGIALDSRGDAYLTGSTDSTNFPTTSGAYQTSPPGTGVLSSTAFVAKLNPMGSALVYSTYLGGRGGASASAIAFDPSGDVYVTGTAGSPFPTTPGAYQPTFDTSSPGSGPTSVFVAKLDPAGSSLLYSTYLGEGAEPPYSTGSFGIAADAAGDAYVTGVAGNSFPITTGASQITCGCSGFAAKLSLGADVLWAPQVSPRTFALTGRRVNRRCVKVTRANRRHRRCTRPIKLQISYQLTRPAHVTFTLTRLLPGRVSRGSCVPQTRKNRKHRSCTRPFGVPGTLTAAGGLGINGYTFNGRIGGRKLARGRYQLTATPTVNGQAGTPQTIGFTIAS